MLASPRPEMYLGSDLSSSWQQDQYGDGPDAADEAEHGPGVLRVAVVAGEEAAHDRIADVEDEHRAEELARAELRPHEREAAPVAEERLERHAGHRSVRAAELSLPRPRSYTAPAEKESTILTKDKLQKLAEELLANPRFAQMFMTAVQAGLETKGHIDRNMQTVLSLLNLPSRADLNKLATKLDVLGGHLTNLNLKVDKLLADRARERRRRRRAAAAARSPVEPE